jgi:hypothetical protein
VTPAAVRRPAPALPVGCKGLLCSCRVGPPSKTCCCNSGCALSTRPAPPPREEKACIGGWRVWASPAASDLPAHVEHPLDQGLQSLFHCPDARSHPHTSAHCGPMLKRLFQGGAKADKPERQASFQAPGSFPFPCLTCAEGAPQPATAVAAQDDDDASLALEDLSSMRLSSTSQAVPEGYVSGCAACHRHTGRRSGRVVHAPTPDSLAFAGCRLTTRFTASTDVMARRPCPCPRCGHRAGAAVCLPRHPPSRPQCPPCVHRPPSAIICSSSDCHAPAPPVAAGAVWQHQRSLQLHHRRRHWVPAQRPDRHRCQPSSTSLWGGSHFFAAGLR